MALASAIKVFTMQPREAAIHVMVHRDKHVTSVKKDTITPEVLRTALQTEHKLPPPTELLKPVMHHVLGEGLAVETILDLPVTIHDV